MDLQTWKQMMELSGAAAFAVRDGALLCCTSEAEALGLRAGAPIGGLLPALWPQSAAEQADGTLVQLAGQTRILRILTADEASCCVLREPAATLPAPNENTLRRAAEQLSDAVREMTAALDLLTDLPAAEDPACARQTAELLRSAYRIRRTAGEQAMYALFRRGGYRLSRRKRSVVTAAAELCGLCADVLSLSGRKLVWKLPERDFPACVDWELCSLMLCELIANAAVHGSEPTIRLEMSRPALNRICFAVSNRMAGDPPPAGFFHRHTAPWSPSDRDAGLGLDLVAAAAELHGGSLLLSADGQGSVTALLTLRMGTGEDARLESGVQLPCGTDAVMMALSPALPPDAFWPIDLL